MKQAIRKRKELIDKVNELDLKHIDSKLERIRNTCTDLKIRAAKVERLKNDLMNVNYELVQRKDELKMKNWGYDIVR